jgi:N-acetyltransferase
MSRCGHGWCEHTAGMSAEVASLRGRLVRLEPLDERHIPALVSAAALDRDRYHWSFVPDGEDEVRRYVAQALEWQRNGSAVPFATLRESDGAVIGTTRFFHLERWAWPDGRAHGTYDACEIGYTWLASSAMGTGANTEAKLLMLAHAFETWGMQSVCFHTDARNEHSRAAIQRVGGTFEGILRSHRLATDLTPRDSARYSIVAAEWPGIKERLTNALAQLR